MRKRVVLASASPRRRRLMAALDQPVDLAEPPDAEAQPVDGDVPEELALRLSLAKAQSVEVPGPAAVIGADTVVALDGKIFGKPADDLEARDMLRRLRGKGHHVVTGVTVLDTVLGERAASATTTRVVMRPYTDDEIEAYVATGSPLDKAGAYAVQDPVFRPAASVDGCYLNVVGLPLCEVFDLLDRQGVATRPRPGWRPPAECRDCRIRPVRGEGWT